MIESIILGIVQGLTEFLPVSSSGHLVVFGEILQQADDGTLTEVLLHLGTFLATLIIFRKQVLDLIVGVFKRDQIQLKKFGFIILASIPTGLAGILLKDFFEGLFNAPKAVAGFMLITGVILLLTKFVKELQPEGEMNWKQALVIGFAQSFAIIPGISRSGSTICTALFLKVSRKDAGEFSFLISLPAIAGATLLHVKDLIETGLPETLGFPIVFGVLASFLSGLFALVWLLKFVKKGKMHLFAPYMFIVGTLGIIFL